MLALSASIAALSLAIALPVQAQMWDGSESGNWYDPNNWSTGNAPTSASFARVMGPAIDVPTIDGGTATASILYVGYQTDLGGISLNIANGATLTTGTAVVGENTNNSASFPELQSGTVSMSGASVWNTDFLTIGNYGDGIINVTDASKITTGSLTMGSLRGPTAPHFATGQLNISGAGSEVTVTSNSATVGSSGEGTIVVDNGGKLTTHSLGLGVDALSSGTITVTGNGSRWNTTGGTLNIGQGGTGAVTVRDGAKVSIHNGGGRVNLASSAGGSGSLTVTGAGSQFEAGDIYAGLQSTALIEVTDGALLKATNLRLGSGATGAATVIVSGQDSVLETTSFSYIGDLGQGTLTLSDGATLRGSVMLGNSAEGTLNIGAAASDAAAAAGIVDTAYLIFGATPGTLVFNHTNSDYTFAPVLIGAGTVHQVAGTTKLSGSNTTFTGNTIIDGGTLQVLGALGGTIAVNSGGQLSGSGSIGGTQVNAGGIIAPTDALNVSGNLGFAIGSKYVVFADAGDSGQIAATGTVTVNGGAVEVQPLAINSRTESHKILSGAVLTGTFDSITTTSSFIDVSLDYTKANEVWLDIARNDVNFDQITTTSNQLGIGKILTNLPLDNPLVAAMTALSIEDARAAMDELSGDTHSTLGATSVAVAGQVQGLVMNRIRQSFTSLGSGAGSVSSYLPSGYDAGSTDSLPVTFWMQGLGEYTHVRATPTAGGLDAGTGGFLGGADVLVDDWRLGAIAGYSRTGFDAVGRSATGAVQNLHAGLYAGAQFDALRLQFNALQTWHGISSSRVVDFGGFTDTLAADYGSRTSMFHGEVGYAFDLGSLAFEPFGSASYAATNTDAYTETGGAAALSSGASRNDAVATVVGLRSSAAMAVSDKLVTLNGMVGWQHQSGQAPTTEFTLGGSTPFTVTGANTASDALVYEAGVNLDLSEQFNIDLLYAGRVSPGDFSHSIKGIVAASF